MQKFSQPASNKRQKLDPTSAARTAVSATAGNAHVQYVRYYREGQRAVLRELLDELEGILDSAEGDQDSNEEGEVESEKEGEEDEEEG